MDPIKTLLIMVGLVVPIMCISVHLDKYHTLIGDRCFNETYDRKPYTLGQKNPIGLSIENLISLIEKIESKLPQLSAQQIVLLILSRFHIDGLHINGVVNMQSQIEMKHRRITEEIMKSSLAAGIGTMEFPEDVLTEDEKCALFFSLSHTVNQTARHDEDIQHTYHKTIHLSRSASKPDNKTLAVKNAAPIQSAFLPQNKSSVQAKAAQPVKAQEVRQPAPPAPQETVVVNDKEEVYDQVNKRVRRQMIPPVQAPVKGPIKGPAQGPVPNPGPAVKVPGNKVNIPIKPISSIGPNKLRLTRRPREKGVVSFRLDRTMAIAANRVLLGTAVGLLTPPSKSVHQLIKDISGLEITNRIPDGQIDPLLAVTLSDLLGIDAGSGLTIPAGDVLFGAEGHWNSTNCQTEYKLDKNGTLATLAELRGGLDGWNIGRKLPTILQQYPTISLSQILRQYYSPKGLSLDATVCNRGYGLVGELQNKIQFEANNYIRVWNGVFYENSYFDNQLTGFIAETWRSFYQFLNKAATERPAEERDFCTSTSIGTDIKSALIETTSNVFFMLDNMPAKGEGFEEEIQLVTNVVRQLNLGRQSGGTVTILVNSQLSNNIDLVDDDGRPILTPMYAIAYNTTSSQCASCRTAYFDNAQTKILERALIMELINKTLMEFDAPSETLSAIPSKNFIWFDFGSLKPAPTERDLKRRYEEFKWQLRYAHRDVNMFMATLNMEDFKDILNKDENWIQMGVTSGSSDYDVKTTQLLTRMQQTPQVLQYPNCRNQKSSNEVYEGFLTPGYKQYWAMYPRHFIKSYNTEWRFKADKQRIKVCSDRFLIPERKESNCDEATEDGGEVRVTFNNPCRGKSFESCNGIYFTIGLSSQSNTAAMGTTDCRDPRCVSPDQIKWSVTHTGVSCSWALNLVPNWTFQVICFTLFLTLFFNNIKHN